MKISPELKRVPALYLLSTMDHAVELGKFPNDFLGIFWSCLSALGMDPYLPYVTIKEGQNVEVSGVAYFRGEKMVGISEPLEIGFLIAYFGNIRTPIPATSGQRFGFIRTAFRQIRTPCRVNLSTATL